MALPPEFIIAILGMNAIDSLDSCLQALIIPSLLPTTPLEGLIFVNILILLNFEYYTQI